MGRDARIRAKRRLRDRIERAQKKKLALPGGVISYSSPGDIPEELREALYCHEILRRAQYSAAQLWLMIKDSQMIVVVKDHSGRSVGLTVAFTEMVEKDLRREWPGAVKLWNETCNTDVRWDLEGSRIRRCAVNMLGDLITNSIRPDGETNHE